MSGITHDQVIAHRQSGSWRNLERAALSIIADVQEYAGSAFQPKLGGGTRLMLALDHRISHDIDLFIRDPQWIGYITPRLNDRVQAAVADYEEAADFLKLNLPDGEIDFIVRGSLLGLPDEASEETQLPLEPVAEVLAKKLFHRGSALTPRDLFDWWTVENLKPELVQKAEMGRLLESKRQGILNALELLPRSTAAANLWGGILAPDKPEMADVVAWGRDALDQYQQASMKIPGQKVELKRFSEYRASKPARSVPSADEPSGENGMEP